VFISSFCPFAHSPVSTCGNKILCERIIRDSTTILDCNPSLRLRSALALLGWPLSRGRRRLVGGIDPRTWTISRRRLAENASAGAAMAGSIMQSYHTRALVPTQECKATGSSGCRRTGVVIAAGAIGTDFLDRISRGRIGEPRIGAYALGPVVVDLRRAWRRPWRRWRVP
jgi:hypothetical protein